MDSRLFEASINGDIATLHLLLEEDPLLLRRITPASLPETPLHIATLLNNSDLAFELLKLQPDFARIRDKNGCYPLHLAAAKGNIHIVRRMLNTDSSLSLLRDKNGRTPIQVAVVNDRVDVLKLLMDVGSTQAVTDHWETILHLCVKYNTFDCANYLVEKDEELVNMKDDRGNTVLHLATSEKKVQMLNLFLTKTKIDVNSVNNNGCTALDVLLQCPSETSDNEIGKILLNFGGKIGRELCSPPAQNNMSPKQRLGWKKLLPGNWDPWLKNNEDWLKDMHNAIIVTATLIATVTFQAGLNPPGGFWQGPSGAPPPSSVTIKPGKAVLDYSHHYEFVSFMYFDVAGLIASLSIILLMISGLPLRNRFMTWLLVMAMWVAVVSMAFAFYYGVSLIMEWNPTLAILSTGLLCWVGIIGLILLWRFIMLVYMLVKWLRMLVYIRVKWLRMRGCCKCASKDGRSNI